MFRTYVVDDDELILGEIVETVPWLDNGFEVCGFSATPLQAIEEIARLQPDVVFSDLKMPAMDGIALITALKQRGLHCEFVMLSAYGTFEDSRAFFRLSGFDYLLKPVQQQDMQMVLERLYKRLSEKQREESYLPDANGANPAFTRLIAYVSENFSQRLNLEKLSRSFNLSPNYICNLFAKHYNTTLTRFITELRMKEAMRQMKNTGKPLKAIAADCGYLDYYYFCKVFKEYYGISPTAHRKQYPPLGELE